jgi:chemotaxis protein MotA
MNLSNALGFVASIVVFFVAVFMSTSEVGIFFDLHAMLIVVGGTGAASSICFSLPKMMNLLKIFFLRIMGARRRDYLGLVQEITILSAARQRGMQAFESAVGAIRDPFLRDAAETLFWVESDVPKEQLRELLETRAGTHYEQYMDEANMFRTIAKFPPAFGLLGTTVAMIVLLRSLGSEASRSAIGPAMAIGLVATLYGVALTNFLLIPIAENLTKQTKEDLVARRMVVEGVMLIHDRLPTKFIEEKVKSYLLPTQRGKATPTPPPSSEARRAA